MKVDKGFELLYNNLSYRRKFIRTIWVTLFGVLLCIPLYLLKDLARIPVNFAFAAAISILITEIIQLVYNYKKWQEEKTEQMQKEKQKQK